MTLIIRDTELPHGDVPEVGCAHATFAAHAARAQALWLAAHDPTVPLDQSEHAMLAAVTEWRLARAWGYLTHLESHPLTPDQEAQYVAEIAASPQALGPDIWAVCLTAGLDPTTITPLTAPAGWPS